MTEKPLHMTWSVPARNGAPTGEAFNVLALKRQVDDPALLRGRRRPNPGVVPEPLSKVGDYVKFKGHIVVVEQIMPERRMRRGEA
jgi:hypothetical protein